MVSISSILSKSCSFVANYMENRDNKYWPSYRAGIISLSPLPPHPALLLCAEINRRHLPPQKMPQRNNSKPANNKTAQQQSKI